MPLQSLNVKIFYHISLIYKKKIGGFPGGSVGHNFPSKGGKYKIKTKHYVSSSEDI